MPSMQSKWAATRRRDACWRCCTPTRSARPRCRRRWATPRSTACVTTSRRRSTVPSVGDVSVESGDTFGAPVVEAARLEAAAPPSGTLCTALVKMLVGSRTSATFVEHPPIVAKGFDEPIDVFEIPWTTAGNAGGVLADSLDRREDLPFAGRLEEFGVLQSAVESARAGRGRAVLIGGEPGVGKSRLVREVARRAANEGAIVLHGRCDDGMGRPYQPFAEAFAGYLRLVPNAAVELGPGGSDLRHILPE